jgi:hypothetical protein
VEAIFAVGGIQVLDQCEAFFAVCQEETHLATVSVPESNFFSAKNKKSPASFQWKFGEIFVKLSC